MSRMVRQTILKMEGLQTRQYVTTGVMSSTVNQQSVIILGIGTPQSIIGRGILTSGSDEKVYLRQMKLNIILSNGTNNRTMFTAYKLRCRKQNNLVSSQVAWGGLLQDNAPTISNPMIDITTSNAFRRYFRIVKSKTFLLDPNNGPQDKKLTIKKFWRAGRQISGDIEGLNTLSATNLSEFWLIVGCMVPTEANDSGVNVVFPPTKVNYSLREFYSYYINEDNDPSSSAAADIPVSAAASYNVFTDVTIEAQDDDQNQIAP